MNQNEFVKLIAPFKDKVFRLAKRLLISTEEAEDASQEVLVKLWRKNQSLDDYNNIEAFAMTMTKNYCLDQLKSKRAGNMQIVSTDFASFSSSSEKIFEDNDSLDWVEKIINQLPEQQRLIIQLRDVEQYEFGEMAKILDMNETAIRVALCRARKTVREFMIKTHSYGIK
jgi:RNA polymerase sigma factor (sigma-70 family)